MTSDVRQFLATARSIVVKIGSSAVTDMVTGIDLNSAGISSVSFEYSTDGQTFLTAGPDECRAWTIVKGTTAPKAAGKIHTDFERGFIRAEIVNYNDLIAAGSVAAAREKGQVRVEGKDYVMQDGDVVNFRFNV